MEKIQYIVEKKIFIVGDRIIKESEISPEQAATLKSKAEIVHVICG